MEVGRRIFHLVCGIIFTILIYFNILIPEILLIFILIGFLISYLSLKIDIPVISWFLDKFDRDEDRRKFPGKGSIFFLIGIFLAVIIFPKNIALASILILSFGDSLSPLLGKYGKIKYFLNKKKKLEGILFGTFCATLAASIFVPVIHAFLGSLAAMLIEGIEIKIGKYKVDDNIIIPLISGIVIYIL